MNDRLVLLDSYIKSNIAPILIENFSADSLKNSVVLNSDINISELNGHYENVEFCPPSWYRKLIEKSEKGSCILVIENINEIPLNEQTKFGEILKYRKISTFDLPKNCLIIVTCSNLNINKINEEIYSLLVHI